MTNHTNSQQTLFFSAKTELEKFTNKTLQHILFLLIVFIKVNLNPLNRQS